MIRFSLVLLLSGILLSCKNNQPSIEFKQVQVAVEFAQTRFPEYCNRAGSNDETNSVLSSFVGDNKSSYIYGSNRRYDYPPLEIDQDSLSELFKVFQPHNAVSEITRLAKNHHFTLINEAHYNGQHRAFTQKLLKPLWDVGYRYLALETLSHFDTLMNKRSYPIQRTGYYSKESAFGNMIRAALDLGYTLVPYETKVMGQGGSERDSVQAMNIINSTLEKDQIGKVLCHVGYGHLIEKAGTNFTPMGAWLIQKSGLEILTIDQQKMTDASTASKIHPFYSQANVVYNIEDHTIFKNSTGDFLRDPVTMYGVDLQVFHPKVDFTSNRANWLENEGVQRFAIPEDFSPFQGYHFFAVRKDEPIDAIPVDQFILTENIDIILPNGEFDAYVVDCTNKVLAQFEITVD